MRKRNVVQLSHKDVGWVNYFPGIEVKMDSRADWLDLVLLPIGRTLANHTSATIQRTPITFWCTVRATARRHAEIFLFVTPAYPLTRVKQVLISLLHPLRDGKVDAGQETIPDEAVPCYQIFQGQILRLYARGEDDEACYYPRIFWRDGFPRLSREPIDLPEHGKNDQDRESFVEAVFMDWVRGDSLRKYQQALSTITP